VSSVFELEGVSARRGPRHVVHDVSLSVCEGETVALLGPSGSGKSTLVRVVLGLTRPESGTVRIRGEVASRAGKVRIPPEERHIAVVFQDLALWPHLSVVGNLRFVLRARRRSREDEGHRITSILKQVGLSGFERRYPGELSGGERQRLAIARALVSEPTAVILDEPLAGADVMMKQDLLGLFGELFANHHAAVLYVTHDPEEAAALSSRFVILEQGRVLFDGPSSDMAETLSDFARIVSSKLRHRPEISRADLDKDRR